MKIHVVKPRTMSVSKLSTESVGSRRKPVANCVHTADATQRNSTVASRRRCVLGYKWQHDRTSLIERQCEGSSRFNACTQLSFTAEIWYRYVRKMQK